MPPNPSTPRGQGTGASAARQGAGAPARPTGPTRERDPRRARQRIDPNSGASGKAPPALYDTTLKY